MLTPPALAGLYRNSVAWFLVSLAGLFTAAPFIDGLAYGRYLDSIATTVTLVAAVLAVGGRRRSLALAGVLVLSVILGCWFQHHRSEGGVFQLFVAALLLFLSFIISQFLRFIMRAPWVNSEVLCAGVATYLLMGFWWTGAYILTARLIPGSFSGLPPGMKQLQGFEALYFSITTLTTVGFGGISPVSRPARMLAMVEALTGTLFTAALVARLVSLHTSLVIPKSGSENIAVSRKP